MTVRSPAGGVHAHRVPGPAHHLHLHPVPGPVSAGGQAARLPGAAGGRPEESRGSGWARRQPARALPARAAAHLPSHLPPAVCATSATRRRCPWPPSACRWVQARCACRPCALPWAGGSAGPLRQLKPATACSLRPLTCSSPLQPPPCAPQYWFGGPVDGAPLFADLNPDQVGGVGRRAGEPRAQRWSLTEAG